MTRCLIIGSGIVGLSTANQLVKNNFQITIVDAEKKGQASKSAAGLLFPLSPWANTEFLQHLCMNGYADYKNFFDTLKLEEKEKLNFYKKDLIILGKNLREAKKWYESKTFVESNYFNGSVNELEKNIKEKYKNYLIIKNVNIINPRSLIDFYKIKLKKCNVIFKNENIENLSVVFKEKKYKIYDYIIITSGAWSKDLIKSEKIKIKPIKGQLLNFKSSKKILNHVLLFDDYYIIPRDKNKITIGSTIEDVGFDSKLTVSAYKYLKNSLSQLFSSEIQLQNMQQTFGFRPFSYDNEPYINFDKKDKRIIYNCGHYRYGILTAISSAKIVNNLIM